MSRLLHSVYIIKAAMCSNAPGTKPESRISQTPGGSRKICAGFASCKLRSARFRVADNRGTLVYAYSGHHCKLRTPRGSRGGSARECEAPPLGAVCARCVVGTEGTAKRDACQDQMHSVPQIALDCRGGAYLRMFLSCCREHTCPAHASSTSSTVRGTNVKLSPPVAVTSTLSSKRTPPTDV